MTVTHRWTVADLEDLPTVEGNRYEIMGGELFVSKQPHLDHQQVCSELTFQLIAWSKETGLGRAIAAPGLILSEEDAVAPDLIWISSERLRAARGEDGKLHEGPDLVVEVLSAGKSNELRDREIKLGLYSRYGVREYWLVDWRARCVEVYRQGGTKLVPSGLPRGNEVLESPVMPGFSCVIESLFEGIPGPM
jgi:Uma2 family endonuclease